MKGREKERSVFRIGAIAERYGIHPQTLRMYEREGLLKPARTGGNTRLYDKIGVRNRGEAIRYSSEHRLVVSSGET